MKDDSQLHCRECIRSEKDGIIIYYCSTTGKPAGESPECPHLSESGPEEDLPEESKSARKPVPLKRNEETLRVLKSHQNFTYAVAGGFLMMLICGVVWAVVTVLTGFQNGWMALITGIITGLSVAVFGGGIDKKFGYLGAFYAFMACFTGNFFSQVMFLADQKVAGYLETLAKTDMKLAWEMIYLSYSPVDFLFYGLAVYEGYLLSFRRPDTETITAIQSYQKDGTPGFFRYRTPLIFMSVILLSVAYHYAARKVNGNRIAYYESGSILSEGNFVNSRQQGLWTYWYETGTKQSQGVFSNGATDSLWTWYYPDGTISRKGFYRNGFEHRTWISYYREGQLHDSGAYDYGRRSGTWITWHENGSLKEQGTYLKDEKNGRWFTWYENGQMESDWNYYRGRPVGRMLTWYPDGRPSLIAEFDSTGKEKLLESWSPTGKQMVINGNGKHQVFSFDGFLLLEETLTDGTRNGSWTSWYISGRIKETGRYENGKLLLIEAWDRLGNSQVRDGNGQYVSYFEDDSTNRMVGQFKNGLRNGLWKVYYPGGITQQELRYQDGLQEGLQKFYYENGKLYCQGWMKAGQKNGKWEWFNYKGKVVSDAMYPMTEGKVNRKFYDPDGRCIHEE